MKGLALLLLLLATACGCTRVEPGKVGIVINMSGDNRGVADIPLQTGWVTYNPVTKDVFEYPTFVQTAAWTQDETDLSPGGEQISFNSIEGLTISGDISLSYELLQENVPAFYVKFRSDDLNAFTHGYLRNVARDQFNEVAGKYKVDDLIGPRREDFIKEVRARVNAEVEPYGVRLVQFGFLGAPRPPENVLNAINMKVAAVQQAIQAENELRREQANAQKAIAKAHGEAESNLLLTASITDQLLEWRRLDVTEKAVAKWNGVRPTVEAGEASGLLLSITPH